MSKTNFIVVEGFDGSGKTSTAKWLQEAHGYKYSKSPTGVFAEVREFFDDIDKVPITDRLAFYTGDCIRVSETLRKECIKNKIVLDRYYPSTVCYHEALFPTSSQNLQTIFEQLYQPDLILYLKTDYEILVERLKCRENSMNDNLVTPEFYKKVEQEFLRYKSHHSFFEINNNGTPEQTKRQIIEILKNNF